MSEIKGLNKLKRVSLTDAAKYLAINRNDLALLLRQGKMQRLGRALKNEFEHWTYIIYETNLERLINDIENGTILDFTS